jgi:hypothetical protein
MIRIDWNRELGTATYGGLIAWGSDAWADICRMAVERGDQDDSATIFDERSMACITVQSIHLCARLYRPTEEDAAAQKARIKTKKKIAAQ